MFCRDTFRRYLFHRNVVVSLWAFTLAATLALFASPAWAHLLGNPVSDLGRGNLEAGIALTGISKEFDVTVAGLKDSDTAHWNHTGLLLDYGVTDGSMLRVELSQIKTGIADTDGTEYGANYRINVGTRQGAVRPLTFGVVAGLYAGNISGDTYSGSYSDVLLAGGASLAVRKDLNAYFAATFDSIDGSVTSDLRPKVSFVSKNPAGAYAGADYSITPGLKIGGEYHLIFESGWALYGLLKF